MAYVCGVCQKTVNATNGEAIAIVICELCKRELREELNYPTFRLELSKGRLQA